MNLPHRFPFVPGFARFSYVAAAAALLAASAIPAAAVPSVAREWNEQLLAAIRLNVPNPPAHARNLFHTAVAMYDAWAAYDTTAVGYLYNEKVAVIPAAPAEVQAARREAISYAAYRILRSRFATGQGSTAILAAVDARLSAMGYSPDAGQAPATAAATPAELGKRIGDAILTWGAGDGFSLAAYPQPYNAAVNPNIAVPLSVLGDYDSTPQREDMPLGFGIPFQTNPNFWQPLQLSLVVDQNHVPQPGQSNQPQGFTGVQGMATTPFSLTRGDPSKPWLDPFGGPSRLSLPGAPSPTDEAYKDNAMDVLRKSAQLNDFTVVDISPGASGNNPPGADTGTGYPVNPVTGLPYPPNPVVKSDYVRVLAEFWADGPNSETPPGHWHVLANEVSDRPELVKRIRGTGPLLDDLEWDVKTYFCLSAATHDAACAAWALKRRYSSPRPITMIRYMGSKGQSSHPAAPAYHEQGLPLEEGVVELITSASAASGGKHELIWNVGNNDLGLNGYIRGNLCLGMVAVYSWPGEHPLNQPAPFRADYQSYVRWQLARDWLPFQRKTFNTPPFPGYISGHSTFSRAAAEALTLLTGSPCFPGGFHQHTVRANTMQIDLGPGEDVHLQWCTYYDAADQAGQSRRWGGIHPYEDDFHGRITGSIAGKSAYTLAEKYWTGAIAGETHPPALAYQSGGTAVLTWSPIRGAYHKVQTSTDLVHWDDATPFVLFRDNAAVAGDPAATFTDKNPAPGKKFYRIARTFSP
jgi:hypothetical protein